MGGECPKCKTKNTSDSEFCKKCAAPLPSSEEISIPYTETLEISKEELTTGSISARRYKIIKKLGKGCTGKVCRKNADHGITEVEDARKRAAKLKSQ